VDLRGDPTKMMRSFMFGCPHRIYSGDENKKNDVGGWGLQHVCRRRAVSTEFWWGNLLEGNTRKTRRQMRDIIKIDLN